MTCHYKNQYQTIVFLMLRRSVCVLCKAKLCCSVRHFCEIIFDFFALTFYHYLSSTLSPPSQERKHKLFLDSTDRSCFSPLRLPSPLSPPLQSHSVKFETSFLNAEGSSSRRKRKKKQRKKKVRKKKKLSI